MRNLLQKWRLLGAMLMAGVLSVCMGSAPAQAQALRPLRMTLINVAGGDGRLIEEQLRRILVSNENLALLDAASVAASLERYELSGRALAKSALRKQSQERIGELMQGLDLEGMLLLDVYGRGKKAQLVVIGPSGRELSNAEMSLKRANRMSDEQVVELLRDAFGVLGPAVLAHRARAVPAPVRDAQSAGVTSELASGAEVQEPQPEPKEASGEGIARVLELSIGLAVGRRSIQIKQGEQPEDYRLNHASPFLGAGLRLSGVPWVFNEAGTSALGLAVFGAYAPFSTSFFDADTGDRLELSSAYTRMGAEAQYLRELSARFMLDLYGGIDLMSVTIAPNAYYTGNRYLTARAGVGMTARLGADAALRLHGGVLPMLDANNSGGLFGESPFSVGYEAGAQLSFNLLDDVFLQAHYTFQFLTPSYPDPNPPITVATSSQDMLHTGGLMVGLRL